MIHLPPDFKEFLQLLNSHHVEYLLAWWLCSWVLWLPASNRHLISLSDLKINKKASGRHKDLNDLENL